MSKKVILDHTWIAKLLITLSNPKVQIEVSYILDDYICCLTF